jgi:hypothetical protein
MGEMVRVLWRGKLGILDVASNYQILKEKSNQRSWLLQSPGTE